MSSDLHIQLTVTITNITATTAAATTRTTKRPLNQGNTDENESELGVCNELQGEGSVGFISSWGFKEKEEIKMNSTFLGHKNILTLEAAGADNVISWEERKKQEEALTQR